MNKTILGILVAILIIGGGVFFIISSSSNEDLSSTSNQTVSQSTTTPDSPDAEPRTASTGQYITYTPGAETSTEGTKVLFFHASWCSTCQALDQNIKAGRIPDGVTIFNVDYDTEDALRTKYGVRTQHTLVQIDDSGNMIKSWYGSYTIDQIMDQVI